MTDYPASHMLKIAKLTAIFLALAGAALAAPPTTTTVPSQLLTMPLDSILTTMTPTTAGAGFNLPQGTLPTSPNNGDVWMTSAGLFFRVAGTTIGPVGAVTGVTINSTTVSGASVGQVLYSDGTKLQALAITGTAGNAVMSNGPTIASPIFSGTVVGNATIPLSILVQGTANSMIGNWSNSTGYFQANTMPPCPDTGGHLNYVSGSGITCGTGGSFGGRVITAAGAVTITTSDDVVIIKKSSPATTTVNLPSSPVNWQIIRIKDGSCNSGTFAITITPSSGNIDNASTYVLNLNCQSVTVTYDGAQWDVL